MPCSLMYGLIRICRPQEKKSFNNSIIGIQTRTNCSVKLHTKCKSVRGSMMKLSETQQKATVISACWHSSRGSLPIVSRWSSASSERNLKQSYLTHWFQVQRKEIPSLLSPSARVIISWYMFKYLWCMYWDKTQCCIYLLWYAMSC